MCYSLVTTLGTNWSDQHHELVPKFANLYHTNLANINLCNTNLSEARLVGAKNSVGEDIIYDSLEDENLWADKDEGHRVSSQMEHMSKTPNSYDLINALNPNAGEYR